MSTDSPSSDSDEQLRRRFRIVNTLLCIARGINTGYIYDDSRRVETLSNRRKRLLDAVASVLVIEHEVLAAVSFNAFRMKDENKHRDQVSPLLSGGLVCAASISSVQDSVNQEKDKTDPGEPSNMPADEKLDFMSEFDANDKLIELDASESDPAVLESNFNTPGLNLAITPNIHLMRMKGSFRHPMLAVTALKAFGFLKVKSLV